MLRALPNSKYFPVLKKALSISIVVIVFSYIGFELWRDWDNIGSISWQDNWAFLFAHLFLLLLMHGLMALGWKSLLNAQNVFIDFPSIAYCFYLPNLGKYLPGKVLFLAGRVELTHRMGAARIVAVATFILENVFLIVGAVFFALPALAFSFQIPYPHLVAVYFAYGILAVFLLLKTHWILFPINYILEKLKQTPISIYFKGISAVKLAVIYLFIWFSYGLSGALLSMLFGGDDSAQALLLTGSAFVIAWLVGFLSFITPGGLGVREGVLVFLMQSSMDVSQVMLLAIVARLTWTVVEMTIASMVFYLPVKFRN